MLIHWRRLDPRVASYDLWFTGVVWPVDYRYGAELAPYGGVGQVKIELPIFGGTVEQMAHALRIVNRHPWPEADRLLIGWSEVGKKARLVGAFLGGETLECLTNSWWAEGPPDWAAGILQRRTAYDLILLERP